MKFVGPVLRGATVNLLITFYPQQYNEVVLMKMLEHLSKLLDRPVKLWDKLIVNHFRKHGWRLYHRLDRQLQLLAIHLQFTYYPSCRSRLFLLSELCNHNDNVSLPPPHTHRIQNMMHLSARLTAEKQEDLVGGASGETCGASSVESSSATADESSNLLVNFPLLPLTKGGCISLRRGLATFKEALLSAGFKEELSVFKREDMTLPDVDVSRI